MYQRMGPKVIRKIDLNNIRRLSELLGDPHRTFKSIHIAGTNGKGSVSFYLASALHELGYDVGLYTSPHYKHYRERIKVNAEFITKDYIKKFVAELIAKGVFNWKAKPSFFEITVAMAFCYFRDCQLDYAVIETGLGGRLDSTNIVTPEISVITNIGLDHTNFLGNTLELIAGEKAGIIKKDIPVIVGRRQDETKKVFSKKTKSTHSELEYADQWILSSDVKKHFNSFQDWQLENMRTAYATLAKMNIKVTSKDLINAWTKGLKNWGYVGRYQWLSRRPRVLTDSAHNTMGISGLVKNLEKETYKQLHIILAIVGDKDPSRILSMLPTDAEYYFSQAKIPRAMPKESLQKHAEVHGLIGKCYTTIPRALAATKKRSQKGDLILVTGSIFTVAEVV